MALSEKENELLECIAERVGALKEGGKSLTLKFTEMELKALFGLFWNSDEMQEIQIRLDNLEKIVAKMVRKNANTRRNIPRRR